MPVEAPVISAVLLLSRSAMALPECECEHFRAWREEFDLELPVRDRRVLANKLIHALSVENAAPICIDVDAVRFSWRFAIDRHAKRNLRAARLWTHDEVQVASMKAE